MTTIHIVFICGSKERKDFQIQQMNDLRIPYPVHFMEAYTPFNSAEYLNDVAKPQETPNELCCFRSHIAAIHWYTENSPCDYVIVCEDDVAFLKDNFVERLNEVIALWEKHTELDYIHIGYLPNPNKRKHCSIYQDKTLFWGENDPIQVVFGMQAYMIKRVAAKSIVDFLHKPIVLEARKALANHKRTIYSKRRLKLVSDYMIPMFLNSGFVFPMLVTEMPFSTLIHKGHFHRHLFWKNLILLNYLDPGKYYSTPAINYSVIVNSSIRSVKTLILRMFENSDDDKRIRDIHRKFLNDCIYVYHNPTLKSDYYYNKEEQLLEIKGEETNIPGILNKTVRAIKYCLEFCDFDILVRSHIKSVIDTDKLVENVNIANHDTMYYGGKKLLTNDGIDYVDGSGIAISKTLCEQLVSHQDKLCKTIPDDIAIGKLFSEMSVKIYDINIVPIK
jgi:GR25 family glycosyltransferase involved in LPS biosynthesis